MFFNVFLEKASKTFLFEVMAIVVSNGLNQFYCPFDKKEGE